MRSIIGWRFFAFVAVPLLLASIGAINLSYDLLNQVENSTNAVEHQRNSTLLTEAVNGLEADLARMATENASWPEAYDKSANEPDVIFFNSTWANNLNIGNTYDTVALIDVTTGKILLGQKGAKTLTDLSEVLGSNPFSGYKDLLVTNPTRRGLVSGFVETKSGPVVLAIAPFYNEKKFPPENGRAILFARELKQSWLQDLQRRLLVPGLVIEGGESTQSTSVKLKGPDGRPVLSLIWMNQHVGGLITAASWAKASLVMGFLIAVMTGIAYVCWSLVQQLVSDENKAQHNALHDHLTGLPNRSALSLEMKRLQEARQPYALAFADLDGFKEVNDSYGHEFGDRLIFMIGKGLRELAPGASLCSRLGGDEFVLLFAGATALEDAKTFADRLVHMLKQPFDMDGRLASVGASIGIADRQNEEDVTEMLRRADIAMYKAKDNGKNCYCVFDASFDFERNENLAIASELKTILTAGNLDVMFQPVVNARTGSISGVEALARWPSTSYRHVTADRFIAIAENSGLIDTLGELILDRACFHAASWPDIRLAVNISALQLNNPNFVARSLGVLHKYQIPCNRVEFEITETSLIHDQDRAKQVFRALQQAGVKVALDDFGTGFSSIGYLRTFQFDRIKIDKSIIGKVLTSASELAVVQGTLLVARGLSAEVTAEGIESAEQASVLRLAGCTELQGFLYYKPMTATQLTETLRRVGVSKAVRTHMTA